MAVSRLSARITVQDMNRFVRRTIGLLACQTGILVPGGHPACQTGFSMPDCAPVYRPLFLFLCMLCSFGIGSMPLRARAELKAGAAKVDITPEVKVEKIPLGGYAARRGAAATGVHDPVYARALVLSQGEKKVALVSLDLCFLPANVKTEVMKRLQSQGGDWKPEQLLLAATHTHSAPDPLAMHSGNTFKLNGWTPFDQKLLDFTAGKIADAIRQADKLQAPAQIGVGATDAGALNRNRRGEKTTDPTLTLLKVTGVDGKAIAAVVNFAAHPTLYDDKMLDISADWPGVMTQDVEKVMGNESVCLFLNGAEGDASPNGVDDQKGDEKVTVYGHKVGDVVVRLLPGIQTENQPDISAWNTKVTLPPRKPNAMFIAAAGQLGATFSQAKALVNSLMPETTTISFARVGNLLFIGMPCEPTAELGLQAKKMAREAGFANPAIVALTNDWLAYALLPEQYRKGNYEAMMSFYGDQFGPVLLAALKPGLNR